MMTWFLTTTIGKTLLKWSAVAALVAAAYWRVYASGKAAAEAERVADDLNALRDKERLNDNIRKMDDAALDRELSRWVRD
ncbi:hypothetical protein [Shinella zoogloeoides]|uniref:hypothetical protein n=1 Tax=Shinella zoogloeoides TaxID=352475 RepID=UPI0028A8702B|nr:hypothetical protein [Shinella zoogloeoides]